jgi:putative inorganic carbon (hco3(-)) transporter
MSAVEATSVWWRRADAPRATAAARHGSRLAFVALATFTAILVLSPQVWFPALKSLRIAFIAAGLAIFAHLLERAVRRRAIDPLHPEVAIALGLVGWSVLTIPFSYWPGGSVAELTDHFLKAFAFFWLIATVVTTLDRLRALLWILVLCSIPLSLTALANYGDEVFLTTSTSAVQRIVGYNAGGSGLTDNPNDLALMLNILIPLAVALALTTRSLAGRGLAALAALIAAAAVIATFSRAGFLGLAATTILTIVALARRHPFVTVGIVAVAVIAGAFLLPKDYVVRVSTIADIGSDPTGSAQGRWADFDHSVELVARSPIIGAGIGQNLLALNEIRGAQWRLVHNVYLQYAVDLGLPGLVLFLWLYVATFRAAGKVRRHATRQPSLQTLGVVAQGLQIALLTFGIAALFHPVAYQFYFYCIAGLALAAKNAFRTATEPTPLVPVTTT